MDTESRSTDADQNQSEQEGSSEQGRAASESGEQLVLELGRLGRKFVEVMEMAWTSDQRHQLERDLRTGLNSVINSLESGLRDIGEQEQTKEFVNRAENVADNVAKKVQASELANELAASLARGLHAMGDRLDLLANQMLTNQSPGNEQQDLDENGTDDSSQEIPISADDEGEPDMPTQT